MDEVDEFLAHYGVKGMKWGVHKSKAEYKQSRSQVRDIRKQHHTGDEIREARKRQAARIRKQDDADDALSDAKISNATKAQISRLEKQLEKTSMAVRTSDDRIIGSKMTTGELVANAILSGTASIQADNIINAFVDRDVARNR